MNKLFYSLTFLFCLFVFQSCQKEDLGEESDINANIELDQFETRAGISNNEIASSEPEKNLYVYAKSITLTFEEYHALIDRLLYPGISIINCDQAFYSFNSSDPSSPYAENLLNGVYISNTDFVNNAITFKISFHILDYKCYNNDFCTAEGLRIVIGTGGNNCTLSDVELNFAPHQSFKLNLSSYIDNTTCAVVDCNDNCCDE